jgi:hypothetical protein
LVGTDKYIKRLGDTDHDWGTELFYQQTQCSASLITMFCWTGGIKQGKQPSFLLLKRNMKSIQLIQKWQMMIQMALMIHSQDIPLLSNAYIFIFHYRINMMYIYTNIYIMFIF